jgi:hypothetical protein
VEDDRGCDGGSGRGLARETRGLDRLREVLQHHRWGSAVMKERVPFGGGSGESSPRYGSEGTSDEERYEESDREEGGGKGWRGMNDRFLRAFESLVCGPDEEEDTDTDTDNEEVFDRLAELLLMRQNMNDDERR